MNTLTERYYALASRKRFLLAATIVFMTSQVAIIRILRPLGEDTVLELQTTFSRARFLEIVNHWLSTGMISHYYAHYRFDHVHPLWYGLFLSGLLAVTLARDGFAPKYQKWVLAPFVASICDVIENLSHVWFLGNLSRVESPLFYLSAVACWTKWIVIAFVLLFVIYRFVRYLFRLGGSDPLTAGGTNG